MTDRRNMINNATESSLINMDCLDEDVILCETTEVVNSCDLQIYNSENEDGANKNIGTREVGKPNSKEKDVSETILDEVIILNEFYNSTVKVIRKENLLQNNIIGLDRIVIENKHLKEQNIRVPSNDVVILDDVLIINHDCRSSNSKSESKDIKILNAFTITLNEYNNDSLKSKAKNKNDVCDDVILFDEDATENECETSKEPIFGQSSNTGMNIPCGGESKSQSHSLLDSEKKKREDKCNRVAENNNGICGDVILFDEDATENECETSKEPIFGQSSSTGMNIPCGGESKSQSHSLLDSKKKKKVKRNITDQESYVKINRSEANQYRKRRQTPMKTCGYNSKRRCPLEKNLSPSRELSSYKEINALKGESLRKHGTKRENKKKQASCGETDTIPEFSNSEFYCYKCIYCSFATPNEQGIKKHVKDVHNESERLKCPFCYCKPVYREYFNHIKDHLSNPPYLCSKCPYFIDCVKEYVSHVLCHVQTSSKKYHCKKCSFATDTHFEIFVHRAVHPPKSNVRERQDKEFMCKACFKIFNSKIHLVQHQSEHKGVMRNSNKFSELNRQLYQCETCPFSCTRKVALKRHEAVHHTEKMDTGET